MIAENFVLEPNGIQLSFKIRECFFISDIIFQFLIFFLLCCFQSVFPWIKSSIILSWIFTNNNTICLRADPWCSRILYRRSFEGNQIYGSAWIRILPSGDRKQQRDIFHWGSTECGGVSAKHLQTLVYAQLFQKTWYQSHLHQSSTLPSANIWKCKYLETLVYANIWKCKYLETLVYAQLFQETWYQSHPHQSPTLPSAHIWKCKLTWYQICFVAC